MDLLDAEALVEPFRIKVVERIRLLTREERERALREAFHSVTYINSADVFIDLATDSGTSAMSDQQWAAMMTADEAYVRSKSFFRFEKAVQEIVGYPWVVPTHQGRAAENILTEVLVKPGDVVLSNTHFDTARAHVRAQAGRCTGSRRRFALGLRRPAPLQRELRSRKARGCAQAPWVRVSRSFRSRSRTTWLLVTGFDGQHPSSETPGGRVQDTDFFRRFSLRENAFFIKQREPGYANRSIADIVQEMFSYGQGCWMSAKKDACVNIGGFIAVRDEALARALPGAAGALRRVPTYGGLARRDLEAIAVGLEEGIDEAHLRQRTGQVAYLGSLFEQIGIRCSKPFGGSGVFVDVQHLYRSIFHRKSSPTCAMGCDVFREGGVRAAAFPFVLKTVDATERSWRGNSISRASPFHVVSTRRVTWSTSRA
jgi:tryptophanase